MSDAKLVLGHHPISQAVTPERATAHGLDVTLKRVSPIHDAFAPMIREQAFDICELAIVSAMQAIAYDKPLILLPVALAARHQHKCIVCNAERGAFGPDELPGKRVAVRAYTQTTGAWVRAILQTEYGVPPLSVHWVTQVGAHVAEYNDPDFIEHVGKDQALIDMLRDGRVDAAIFGNDLPDLPWIAPVIPDAETAGERAYRKSGIVSINHILSVRRAWAEAKPERLKQVMALFRDASAAAKTDTPELYPIGLAAMRPSIETLLASAYDQAVLPHPLYIDEMFKDARAALGALAD